MLSELEGVHKELQGEHIQDWVAKGDLKRKFEITDRENHVAREGLEVE
jgi:hypothetical protein